MSALTGDLGTQARDADEPVTTQVIMLNGGSSSGKSGLARCLQAVLPDPWLTFGVDTFMDGMPPALTMSRAGIEISRGGEVVVGPVFRALQDTWLTGIAAMARAGGRIIVDEVFLDAAVSQQRWRDALAGLGVLWVGVRCAADVAAGREVARANRMPGLARAQADLVHRGVSYDLEVDTARAEPIECARIIAARVSARPPPHE